MAGVLTSPVRLTDTASALILQNNEILLQGVLAGAMLSASADNKLAPFGGNATTTRMYLSQLGSGGIPGVPSWRQVAVSEVTGAAPLASPVLTGKVSVGAAGSTKLSTLTVQPPADLAGLTGTTTVNASNTVVGVGTLFLSELGIGDRISVSSAASTYKTVATIASNTSLTLVTGETLGDGTSQTINRKSSIQLWNNASGAQIGLVQDDGTWKTLGLMTDNTTGGPYAPSTVRFSAGDKLLIYADGTSRFGIGMTANGMTLQATSNGGTPTDGIRIFTGNSGAAEEMARFTVTKNFLFVTTTQGTGAVGVFALGPATPPTTSPAGVVQLYNANVAGAATAGLHVRDEGGNVFKIGNGLWVFPSADVALARNAANVMEVNTGVAGTFADMRARLITESMGAGTGTTTRVGLANVQTSSAGVGNGADTTDDTLFTYTLPLNSLSTNGKSMRIRAWGKLAANANNKTVKLWFAGTAIVSSGVITFNAKDWSADIELTRIDATHVSCVGTYYDDTATAEIVTVTANLVVADLAANTSILKVTGASPTTGAANDVLGHGMKTWFEN